MTLQADSSVLTYFLAVTFDLMPFFIFFNISVRDRDVKLSEYGRSSRLEMGKYISHKSHHSFPLSGYVNPDSRCGRADPISEIVQSVHFRCDRSILIRNASCICDDSTLDMITMHFESFLCLLEHKSMISAEWFECIALQL